MHSGCSNPERNRDDHRNEEFLSSLKYWERKDRGKKSEKIVCKEINWFRDYFFIEQKKYISAQEIAKVWFTTREVTKGERRMPWLLAATKDAVSCENVRGSANRTWSARIRMGQPGRLKTCHSKESQRGELKHLSIRRKRKKYRFPK